VPDYYCRNMSFLYDTPWWTEHILGKTFDTEYKAVRKAITSVQHSY
jgi:hypothetical protein